MKAQNVNVTITAPKLQVAEFRIVGSAPLVIHRFDQKVADSFRDKIKAGTTPRGKAKHEGREPEAIMNAGRYIGGAEGKEWDGFNASAIRCAMISACRLVNFKMTLAKLSIFVLEDGRDLLNPLIPLVRIDGKPEMSEMVGRTETDVAMLVIRPMYFPWSATLRIRFDADQFKVADVSNLLMRVGQQVGICEGRPDSKNSAGMGWGTFDIA
jgi:hypothetical protein